MDGCMSTLESAKILQAKAPFVETYERSAIRENCRDRHQYGRWQARGAYVDIEDGRFALNGVSIGGFQLHDDECRLRESAVVVGTINWLTGGWNSQIEFKAKVLWVDYHERVCSVAFGSMEDHQIDKLLGMLTVLEGELRIQRDRQERAKVRRRWAKRAVILLSTVGAVFAIGYGVWIFMIGKVQF